MDTKRVGGPVINSGIGSERVSKSDKPELTDDVDKKSGKAPTDFSVSFSNKAQEMLEARNKAMEIAKSTSPIREDRVQELRERIKNGTYQIDSGKIADGIMREAIRDELAKNPEV